MVYNEIDEIRKHIEVYWSCKRDKPFNVDLKKANNILSKIRNEYISRLSINSGYSLHDVNELWNAVIRFYQELPNLVESQNNFNYQINRAKITSLWNYEVRYLPWGTILVCIPSNALIPLALILPIALLASGNRVIVAFSKNVRTIGNLLLKEFQEVFHDNVICWAGSVKNIVYSLIKDKPIIDLLYYMGGSKQYSDISALCAQEGVSLHYEGEGRSLVIIDGGLSKGQIKKAAKYIYKSKTFCHGMMCSSPNAVIVHKNVYDQFLKYYQNLCSTCSKSIMFSENKLEELRVLYGKENPEILGTMHPCYWETDINTLLKAEEIWCPGILISLYDDKYSLLKKINKLRFRLQIAVFDTDRNLLEELISSTSFARYCYWLNPAAQDSCVPWGNYGRSGYSYLNNFYEKGLRKVIVEEG